VGSNNPTREMKMACCMVLETVEMRIPRERAIRIYSMLSANSRATLPFTGSPKTSHESSRIRMTLMKERRK